MRVCPYGRGAFQGRANVADLSVNTQCFLERLKKEGWKKNPALESMQLEVTDHRR